MKLPSSVAYATDGLFTETNSGVKSYATVMRRVGSSPTSKKQETSQPEKIKYLA